jgi:ribonucleoside-triphosphate reductase
LEATPAEGTSYRLGLLDKKYFPDIFTAGDLTDSGKKEPYYTNSSFLPVNYTDDAFTALDHQDKLQTQYTGGTVLHLYLGEQIEEASSVKQFVKKVCENYHLPYVSITPTFSVCPEHGYLKGKQEKCPTCGASCEVYSRVVGFLRPVQQWNEGKECEFNQRVYYNQPKK